MPKLKQTHIHVSGAEDAAITRAAMSDPDSIPFSDMEWDQAKPSVRIGRPKAAITKERITIRLSADVVRSFKVTGKGWQTRLDAALKDWLSSHSPA